MLLRMQPGVLENTLKEEQPVSANGAKVPRQHAESVGRPKSPRVGRSQRREAQPWLPRSANSQQRQGSWWAWPAGASPKRYS